ncbi:hypothetical protein LZ683_16330 [Comamonas testosteroni]|uniref:cell division protein FtsZ n=1 Tax=Comamonas testosteroni TaxID=285 RepID=UPI0023AAFBA7|nr:cell division protein FtsZ [Comamonas testosteroni]WEE75728.1 hypothetical protein LZ683_16330 [Comamonas testosteroni]
MIASNKPSWFIVGYVRTVPGEHSFVFPVVQNGDMEGKAYYGLNGKKLEFFEPSLQESMIRINPVEIPGIQSLEDALPLYGYEYELGKVWIGDARQMSKTLIDFACSNASLTDRARLEISDFVGRLLSGKEFISRKSILILGRATLAASTLEVLDDEVQTHTVIKVLGVAEVGYSAVKNMIRQGVNGVEFILVNSEENSSNKIAGQSILLPRLTELGSSSSENVNSAVECIRNAVNGTDMLFITSGMSSSIDIDAFQAIARIAKEMGTLTVGVVRTPFKWEVSLDLESEGDNLSKLEACVDSLFVVDSAKLPEVLDHELAALEASEILKNVVSGISEIINEYGHVNVDFEDIRIVLGEPGRAAIGMGAAKGPERARIAAEQAVLLNGSNLLGAKGILVLVTAAKGSLKLSEARLAMSTINSYASPDASVIYGASYDDRLEDQVRVILLATGLSNADALTSSVAKVENCYGAVVDAPLFMENQKNSNDMDIVDIPDYLKH